MHTIQDAIDFAITNGLVKYDTQFKLTHAPFCLTPFLLKKAVIKDMISLTPVFNELMMKVGENKGFLYRHLKASALTDDFIKRLLDLNAKVDFSNHLQICRNDFLFASADGKSNQVYPKQVEYNAISNSFPYLATKTNLLHRYLSQTSSGDKGLIENEPLEKVVDVMAEVVRYYDAPRSCVLMVVQKNEQNLFDQRGIEYRLLKKYGIPTFRQQLEQIAENAKIKDGHLLINGHIAALTYFRAAYTPNDYPDRKAWKGREIIEHSSSVKCPSIGMQLAGTKKIQQVLSKENILEQFISPDQANLIKKTFVGMFDLNELVNSVPAMELAIKSPEKYVLKPQREGGGNNLYEDEMVEHLNRISAEERNAYILMERIFTPTERSILVVDGRDEETQTISEIGRYGACLHDGHSIRFNKDIGYLVRTKSADKNEGGVCAGHACLNVLRDPEI
jgi:glutathione synthase